MLNYNRSEIAIRDLLMMSSATAINQINESKTIFDIDDEDLQAEISCTFEYPNKNIDTSVQMDILSEEFFPLECQCEHGGSFCIHVAGAATVLMNEINERIYDRDFLCHED